MLCFVAIGETTKTMSTPQPTEQNSFESIQSRLTEDEKQTLDSMKKFPLLDKSSQNRLRAKVNAYRKNSEAFAQAFDYGLSNTLGIKPKHPKIERLLGNVKDVLTHPVTAAKAKIGASLLKRRNSAPEILEHPHPILSAVAEEWDFENNKKEDLVAIVRKLGAALRGVSYGDRLGMAAPQIGISKRVLICQGAVCVNPTFTPPGNDPKQEVLEGCYSVKDNKLYKVMRSKYGWGRWKSVDGTPREFRLSGTDAIVFQHELSHLDGKCCCDLGVEYIPPKKEEIKK